MKGPSLLLHLGIILMLLLMQFVISDYALLSLTRILVLAVFASGYNLLFGYTGLLSLGHAMFFASGAYAAALGVTKLGMSIPVSFVFACLVGGAFSAAISAITLRAKGVAFMIVTLMFSQAAFLTILYFGNITRGDEGITIAENLRRFSVLGFAVDLTNASLRYNLALVLYALSLGVTAWMVLSPMGRVLIAIRENENRTSMLGYDVMRYKFVAMTVSGTLSAVSGAAYAILFSYAGATLASIEYSINPLLWSLLGGASTLLGPLLGTGFMMVLNDLASSYTDARLLAVGVVLVLLVVFFPKGILGTVRQHWIRWLP